MRSSIAGADAIFYTEAYFASDSGMESAWSALLRTAKDPATSDVGWDSVRRVCDRAAADIRRRSLLFSRIDAVVCVPSRMCRLRRRGMSLPDEFARVLHDSLGLRYEADALIPAVDHIEIKRIAFEFRRHVVAGTIEAPTRRLVGKSVLLVDDITTTGATVAECVDQLRSAGAAAVFAYTLGRTFVVPAASAGGRGDQPQID